MWKLQKMAALVNKYANYGVGHAEYFCAFMLNQNLDESKSFPSNWVHLLHQGKLHLNTFFSRAVLQLVLSVI